MGGNCLENGKLLSSACYSHDIIAYYISFCKKDMTVSLPIVGGSVSVGNTVLKTTNVY